MGNLDESYISKNTYVFNPSQSGTYEIELSGKVIQIEATDTITLDSFEDGDISEYTVGDLGSDLTVSASTNQAYNGSYSKRYHMQTVSAQGNPSVLTTSGLNNYPSYPTKITAYLYLTSVENAIWMVVFGTSTESTGGDGIRAEMDNRNGNIALYDYSASKTLISKNQDWSSYDQQWLRFEIDWGLTADNEITFEIYEDKNDTLINSVTATSSNNQSNSGFGTRLSNGSLGSGYSAYFDYFRSTDV